jgi:hypothetical protein
VVTENPQASNVALPTTRRKAVKTTAAVLLLDMATGPDRWKTLIEDDQTEDAEDFGES